MIKAVVFDLDDTLIPEIEYVKSGFCAIAKEFGDEKISDMLWTLFEEDRNNVYQRAGFLKEELKFSSDGIFVIEGSITESKMILCPSYSIDGIEISISLPATQG